MGTQTDTTAGPTSTVELSISCRDLKDKDVFSKSDPICVLFEQEMGQSKWTEVARTEIIKNTLNPDFAKKFLYTYYFEKFQKLKFEIYDIDSQSPRLSEHDFLGSTETTLGEIVSSVELVKPLRLPATRGNADEIQHGTIKITAEELSICKEDITLEFNGQNLSKKRFLCIDTSNPFLTLSKVNESGSFTVVHRTENIPSPHPKWRKFTLSVQSLCNGDFDRVIKLTCYHFRLNGNHKYIGECTLTLNQIMIQNYNQPIELANKKKEKETGVYTKSGELMLLYCQKNAAFSFLDYIRGGTELLCTVAIDFTASNGEPHLAKSLHHMNPQVPNQYVQALRAVGDIIQDYDSDKLFPVLGFGAKIPPDGCVSHNFFVTLDPSNPYCFGVDGIINAYSSCLPQIEFCGPTNFSPIIRHVADIARVHVDGSKYHILLIITDGIITDMDQTKQAVVQASNLPLSIIIIGVGRADFESMEELDGDIVRVSWRGKFAERDIVQFVPFRDFDIGLKGTFFAYTQAKLAKAVLAEVPTQFLSFMRDNGIKPSIPRRVIQLPPDPEIR